MSEGFELSESVVRARHPTIIVVIKRPTLPETLASTFYFIFYQSLDPPVQLH
jgi:hypothetical protein